MNVAFNEDCMEVMKRYPDKYFDLAVVDPPYGSDNEYRAKNGRFGGHFDNYDLAKIDRRGCGWATKYGTTIKTWDKAPGEDYFNELFRVSKNQIIWGGNYFSLPPARCFLVWRKLSITENFTMSMAEYAWTSLNENAKVFEAAPQGKAGEKRFHPTQKPVELYRWIFKLFAKEGYKILDTHLGSGSSRIAAYD